MYLRKVAYQLEARVKSLVPYFHKSHLRNLTLLVGGIAYNESVSLPKSARTAPYKLIQKCEKLLRMTPSSRLPGKFL